METTKKPEIFTSAIGIILENATPAEVNRAALDLIAFRQVNSGTYMMVMSNHPEEFAGLGRVIGFNVTRMPDFSSKFMKALPQDQRAYLQNFKIWKSYYSNRCPDPPPVTAHYYHTRVTNPETVKLKISEGNPHYPNLERLNNDRLVPPGTSPQINKIPPRHQLQNFIPNPFFY